MSVKAAVYMGKEREESMNFAVYMIGVILVVVALAYGAHVLGVSQQWIGIGVMLVVGLGIMGGIVRTRRRGPS